MRQTTSMGGGRTDWQAQAWEYLEQVGELEYFVSWRSASASRCRVVASALDPQGAPTGDIAEDDPHAETVRKIVRDIGDGVAGQAKLVDRAAYLLSIVGECWIGLVVRDPERETDSTGTGAPLDITRPGYPVEQWLVFGRDEIRSDSTAIVLSLPDGAKHTVDPDVDMLFRVWDPHPKDPSKPVSPVWSNRNVLESIVTTSAAIDQASNNRLVGNGILFVPQEMSLPSTAAPTPAGTGTDTTVYFEPDSAQSLQDLLFDVATAATKDPTSTAARLPIVAAVPGEQIEKVSWLRAGSDIPDTALKILEGDIRRLATGLHMSPERLLGMSTGNHWTSWLIDETDVKVHIAPVVELIVGALTREVLRYKLIESGIDPDAYLVWYDASSLTQDPDKSDEARDAFDRGALTARALREHLGFAEDDGYDLTTLDGWTELALDRISADPSTAPVFQPILDEATRRVGIAIDPAAPDIGTPVDTPPPADTPVDGPPADPGSEDGPPLTAAMTIARVCVGRALELANKRRKTRSDSAIFQGIPIEHAHTRLDPVPLSDAPELTRGWTTGVSDADLSAMGLDPRTFRATVEGVAALALATSSPPVLTPSMLRRTP